MNQTVKTMASNNMHHLISIRYLALYAFVAQLSACGSSPVQDAKTASGNMPAVDTVPVFILKADTLKKTVELPGELIPYQQTDLYAKVSGFVRTMKVDI